MTTFLQETAGVASYGYSGDAARVLKNGVVVVDWTAGGVVPNVPIGDGYTVEIRRSGVVATDQLAVGEIVLAIGQSNMAGWFQTGGLNEPTPSGSYMLQNGQWVAATGEGATTFARVLSSGDHNAPVAFVNAAVGSTALLQANAGSAGYWLNFAANSLEANAVKQLQLVGGHAALTIWIQGEQDALATQVNPITPGQYASGLEQLFAKLQTSLTLDHIVIGGIAHTGTPEVPSTTQSWTNVLLGDAQVARDLSNVSFVPTPPGVDTVDGLHLDGVSRAWQAAGLAAAALAQLGLQQNTIVDVTGTSGDDTLIASAQAARMFGDAGNDSIVGSATDDIVRGDLGNDTIRGGGGHDYLSGGAGDDLVIGGAQSSELVGGAGADTLIAGDGGDYLAGGTQNDCLIGGAGNDSLDGGTGTNTLIGGAGDDAYTVHSIGDVVIEPQNGGHDKLISSDSSFVIPDNVEDGYITTSLNLNITGNAINNYLSGGAGNNLLLGADGNDTLSSGGGIDTLIGGRGDDTYIVAQPGSLVLENPGEGFDTIKTSLASYALDPNVEALTFTGVLPGTGTGNDLDNSLTGNFSANLLIGLGGNDTLTGAGGQDTLVGGLGDDTYIIAQTGAMIVEKPGEGIDTVKTTLTAYTLDANVEALVYTGSGSFKGVGNGYADVITGGPGLDTLDGGAGASTLIGGAGNDVYLVSTSSTVIIESSTGGYDAVNTTASSYTLGDFIERLNYTGVGSFYGVASPEGSAVYGGAGDDTLDGGAAVSQLVGGAGNDSYIVSNAKTSITEAAGAGNDTVVTSLASYTLPVNVENLSYVGSGSFSAVGSASANVITGGSGADTLNGSGGADTLIGGAGDDTYVMTTAGVVIVELPGGGIDTVKTTLGSFALPNFVETLAYTGTAAFAGAGNGADNQLSGGPQNDTLTGGGGNDNLDGGAGKNVAVYSGASTRYGVYSDGMGGLFVVDGQGGSGPDGIDHLRNIATLQFQDKSVAAVANLAGIFLLGSSGVDSLVGGSGSDVVAGLGGGDLIDGGGGSNTALYGGAASAYAVYGDGAGGLFVEARASGVVPALFDHLLRIQTLQFADGTVATSTLGTGLYLAGTSAAETLSGGAGDDLIAGAGGGDLIDGGGGSNTVLYGGPASAYAAYGDGAGGLYVQTLGAGSNPALFDHLLHIQTLQFADGAVATSGLGAALYLQVTAAAQTLTGGAGDDLISGGGGGDLIDGGAGSDTALYAGTASQYGVYGDGAGGLYVQTLSAGSNPALFDHLLHVETLRFADGALAASTLGTALYLQGTSGADSLVGGSGNDTLVGGGGDDRLDGGSGSDTAIYAGPRSEYQVLTEASTGGLYVADLGAAGEGRDHLVNVETLQFSDGAVSAATAATGLLLQGSAAAETLTGSTGDDLIFGGGGGDLIDGAGGNDTVAYAANASQYGVSPDGSGGYYVAPIAGGAADHLLNVSLLAFNDGTLAPSALSVVDLSGTSAADHLIGSPGSDRISGLSGDDTIEGGGGLDTAVYAGPKADYATYADGAGGLFVLDLGGEGEGLDHLTGIGLLKFSDGVVAVSSLSSASAIAGSGVALSDTSTLGELVLLSGGGNRVLGNGTKTIVAYGGVSQDYAVTIDGAGAVSVSASGWQTLDHLASVSWLRFSNGLFAPSQIQSGALLQGTSGADSLVGGSGNDTLVGGGGDDRLDGGSGSDTAIYAGPRSEYQVLTEASTGGLYVADLGAAGDGRDHLVNVETLQFSDGAVSAAAAATGLLLQGSAAAETLTGSTGDDLISGGGGGDLIDGAGGNDTVAYAANASQYVVYRDGAGGVYVRPSGATNPAAFDHVTHVQTLQFADGSLAASTATGVLLVGTTAMETLAGGSGDDLISGGGGGDLIDGGAGSNTVLYTGTASQYALFGDGAGGLYVGPSGAPYNIATFDHLLNVQAIQFNDGALTASNVDGVFLLGSSGVDSLVGGSGSDVVAGLGGGDLIDGGGGSNTALYGGAASAYAVYGDGAGGLFVEARASGVVPALFDHLLRIQTLQFADGTVATSTLGTGLYLAGTSAAETLSGGAGDDLIAGAGGGDLIDGGGGSNTVLYGGPASAYAAYGDGAGGLYVQTLGAGSNPALFDHLLHIQTLQFADGAVATSGLGAALYLQVTAAAQTLTGGAGDDLISGGGGGDLIDGGAGSDTALYAGTASQYGVYGDGAGGLYVQTLSAGSNPALFDHLLHVETLRFADGALAASTLGTALYLQGTSGADSLVGGSGNDTLVGGGGDDRLDGGSGSDTAIYAGPRSEYQVLTEASTGGLYVADLGAAGDGRDHLVNVETLQFSDGAVSAAAAATGLLLQGSAAAETLTGSTGDDLISGGGGGDLIDGAGGNDTVAYAANASQYVVYRDGAGGVYVRPSGATNPAAFDHVTHVQTLQFADGSLAASTATGVLLVGTTAMETLAGGSGDDLISGGGGGDLIDGGAGSNTVLYTGTASQYALFGDGAGGLYVGPSGAPYNIGNFDHLLNVQAIQFADASLPASATSLMRLGSEASDVLNGGTGSDVFRGGGGNDTLIGGGGTDVAVYTGPRADYLVLQDGATTGYVVLNLGPEDEGVDRLSGVASLQFSDGTLATAAQSIGRYLAGTPAAETLSGAAGADYLIGGGGNDFIDGGAGTDIAAYVGTASRYVVTPDGSGGFYVTDGVAGSGGEGRDHLINVETLRFADGGVAIGAAASGAALTGTAGADLITGAGGNDTIDGGAGIDTMAGAAGNDIYYVDNAKDLVSEVVGGGADTVFSSVTWTATSGSEIEKLAAAGTAAISLNGNALQMELDGNAGANTLSDGGAGDTLIGGGGNDTYLVSNPGTVVVEGSDGAAGYDTVKTTLAAYALTANVEVLTFTGAGGFSGMGNALANVVTGGAWNDTLDGGAGVDRLVGGLGDDTYYADNGADVIVENAGEGRDTVLVTASSFSAPANVEVMKFIGTGAFTGYASATGVSIQGGLGNDTLIGGKGPDTLNGGGGNDVLTGNTGPYADMFRLNGPGQGVDRVVTYHAGGEDHVLLPGVAFGISSLAGVAFVNGTSAPAGSPALVYDATGKLYWDSHGGDAAHQTLIATFDAHPALSFADFILG